MSIQEVVRSQHRVMFNKQYSGIYIDLASDLQPTWQPTNLARVQPSQKQANAPLNLDNSSLN